MKDWKKILLNEEHKVLDAIKVIDSTEARAALVVNGDMKLIGTITDGDVRRGILKGVKLDSNVSEVLNHDPIVAPLRGDKILYESELNKHQIHQLPLVDESGFLSGFYLSSDLYSESKKDNPVVLMAGGLGTRLGDLTTNCPKPMLKIGGKPILETIINNFKQEGFSKFYFAVNYKSEVIEDHFGNGDDYGVKIEYLRENTRLGTAGSLSLINNNEDLPIVVMNGDLLTSISVSELIKFHTDTKAHATTCIREFDMQVPFGVVHTEGTDMIKIIEKPTQKYFVNAGIYVINPSMLDKIPKGEFSTCQVFSTPLLMTSTRSVHFPSESTGWTSAAERL